MYSSPEELRLKSNWDGAKGNSRKKLLKDLKEFVSPQILLPDNRLLNLVSQAIQYQKNNCLFHNTLEEHVSLFQDHSCTSKQIPTVTKNILEKHTDEVWYIKFSYNGKYLASASKDNTIILWDVLSPDVKAIKVLIGHIAPISFVSWSKNDQFLLSCGNDNLVKLWDVQTGSCIRTFSRHTEFVAAVAWLPDGKHFISGGIDKNIYMMDIDGNEIYSWTCARVNDLAVSNDGKFMVVICHEKKLRIYDLEEKTEDYIQETESPTSLEISSDNKHILVNISSHEIHVWDVSSKRIIQKYRGQKQSRFVIRSCFGGANQAFVISGSEDSQVYIWHRSNGELLKVLSGHSGTVNTVSWNPVNPSMFASCSDDHTIRIWTTEELLNR
jgi:WD40 repeat protein